jgi:hypothetical protein
MSWKYLGTTHLQRDEEIMGAAKQEGLRWEDLVDQVRLIADEVGAITIDHENGEDEYNFDIEADRHAYALATVRWKLGKLDGTRQEIVEAVKCVIENSF